jgi:hypothetical protein
LDFSIITVRATPDSVNDDFSEGLWSRMGFRLIDFPFTQLPLHDQGSPVKHVRLGFKAHETRFVNRTHLNRNEMEDIIHAANYFRNCSRQACEYREYQEMLQALASNAAFRLL